jgi:ribosomal protein S2
MIRGNIKFVFSQLICLGAFLGHTVRRVNNFMSLYFYGIRTGMICFNLSYTSYNLRRAISFFLEALSYRGTAFFLAGNLKVIHIWFRKQRKKFRRSCCWYAGPYVGGLVSNFNHVKKNSPVRLRSNMIRFNGLPNVVLVFDSNEYFNGFMEAYSRGVPSIGLVDSDLEYQDASYPIFMNNETFRIKFFFCNFFFSLIKYQRLVERFLVLVPGAEKVEKREEQFSRVVSSIYRKSSRISYRFINPILLRFANKCVRARFSKFREPSPYVPYKELIRIKRNVLKKPKGLKNVNKK